jgi:hypothetical protein
MQRLSDIDAEVGRVQEVGSADIADDGGHDRGHAAVPDRHEGDRNQIAENQMFRLQSEIDRQ